MVDSSGGDEGTDGYPNGNELFVMSDYTRGVMGYRFPSVPKSRDEFLEQGLNVGVLPSSLSVQWLDTASNKRFLLGDNSMDVSICCLLCNDAACR